MGRTIDMVVGDKAIKVKMYTGGDDPDLPDHVAKLPTLVRSRWVNSYHYALVDYKDAARAGEEADRYTTVSVEDLGSMGIKEQVPITASVPNTDVGDVTRVQRASKDWFTRFKELFTGGDAGSGDSVLPLPSSENVTGVFRVYKGTDDRMRVLTVYSNNFKDREKQILSEAAHKEYVEAAEAGRALYPDLHLWHGGPHTKWGTVETVSFVDGFAVAGGVVDPGKEHVALKLKELADSGELAVSFGFYGLRGPDGVWHAYRPFEISPLPVGSEANPLTSIDLSVGNKENSMAFSESKKGWLKSHFGMDDAAISSAEKAFGDMAAAMQRAGIEYKEAGSVGSAGPAAPVAAATPTPPPAPPPTPQPAPPDPAPVPPTPTPQDFNVLADLAVAVKALTDKVEGMETAFAAYKEQDGRTVEQRAQDQVLARIAGAGAGHRPTQSNGNVLPGLKEHDSGDDWLDAALGHSLGGPLVPAGAGAGIAHAPNNGEVK